MSSLDIDTSFLQSTVREVFFQTGKLIISFFPIKSIISWQLFEVLHEKKEKLRFYY